MNLTFICSFDRPVWCSLFKLYQLAVLLYTTRRLVLQVLFNKLWFCFFKCESMFFLSLPHNELYSFTSMNNCANHHWWSVAFCLYPLLWQQETKQQLTLTYSLSVFTSVPSHLLLPISWAYFLFCLLFSGLHVSERFKRTL